VSSLIIISTIKKSYCWERNEYDLFILKVAMPLDCPLAIGKKPMG
jgi:hypothetical protein